MSVSRPLVVRVTFNLECKYKFLHFDCYSIVGNLKLNIQNDVGCKIVLKYLKTSHDSKPPVSL